MTDETFKLKENNQYYKNLIAELFLETCRLKDKIELMKESEGAACKECKQAMCEQCTDLDNCGECEARKEHEKLVEETTALKREITLLEIQNRNLKNESEI